MKSQVSMDPNYQKTHYFLDTSRCKRQRTDDSLLSPIDSGSHGTVFKVLSHESDEHVRHRFELYEKVWLSQRNAIEAILGSANNEFFSNLVSYIQQPLSCKLDCAFLSLSSNIANNLRILDEFSSYVVNGSTFDNRHVRVVRLNSKVCFNGKSAIKEVVKQVLDESKDTTPSHPCGDETTTFEFSQGEVEEHQVKIEDNFDTEDGMHDSDEDADADGDGDTARDDGDEGYGGRISYDFEIVEDWVQHYYKRYDSESKLRIIIVLDDADSFQNEVLNLLIQLFGVFSSKCPIKVVMGLITKNVSSWVNANITSKLRNLILGVQLEAKDNKDIGFRVIDEILLQNSISEQNPLLMSSHLSLIILNRFENSNNSIDSLITELKLSFMTYFYQLHLSSLLDSDFIPENFYYDGLRKLPSFKTHVEFHLHQFIETREMEHKLYIHDLFENDAKLHNLFEDAKVKFQEYQNTVMNAVNIVYWLCDGKKEKFEVYKLITNNQLINSPFLTELLKSLKNYSDTQLTEFKDFLFGDLIITDLKTCADEDVKLLKKSVSEDNSEILDSVMRYFHENKSLNMKINDNLFNEVLTINGGNSELDEQIPRFSIEENFENLMINSIRPKLREVIEVGLDEPQVYLRNPLVSQQVEAGEQPKRLLGPSLSTLYLIYKDAPVSINLWDFYIAFKQSLPKGDIIREIETNYQSNTSSLNPLLGEYIAQMKKSDEVWDKVSFSWFIQSCFELNSLGFIREKSKGDYMEKMIWRNL